MSLSLFNKYNNVLLPIVLNDFTFDLVVTVLNKFIYILSSIVLNDLAYTFCPNR